MDQLLNDVLIDRILPSYTPSDINAIQAFVLPIIKKNWKLIFIKCSKTRLEEMMIEMLKRVNYINNVKKSGKKSKQIYDQIGVYEKKSDSILKSKLETRDHTRKSSVAHTCTTNCIRANIHCLNPIVVRKIAIDIGLKFGLSNGYRSLGTIYNLIAEGVYIQFKDILIRLQKMSNHRLETLSQDQIIEINSDPRRLVNVKDEMEIAHNNKDFRETKTKQVET